MSSAPSLHSYDSISSIHSIHSEPGYAHPGPGSGLYSQNQTEVGYGTPPRHSVYGGPESFTTGVGGSSFWDDQRTVGSYVHAESHSAPLPGSGAPPSHFDMPTAGGGGSPPFPPVLGTVSISAPPQSVGVGFGYPGPGSSFYPSSVPEEFDEVTPVDMYSTPPRNTNASVMGYSHHTPPPLNSFYPPPIGPPSSFPPASVGSGYLPPTNNISPYNRYTAPTPGPPPPFPGGITPPHPSQMQTPPSSRPLPDPVRPLPDPFSVNNSPIPNGHRPLSRVSSMSQAQIRPPTTDPNLGGSSLSYGGSLHGNVGSPYGRTGGRGRPSLPTNMGLNIPPPPPLTPPRNSPPHGITSSFSNIPPPNVVDRT